MIDRNNTKVRFTFNLAQVDVILAALGRMPHDDVEHLVQAVRAGAMAAIRSAELTEDENVTPATTSEAR